MKLVNKTLSVLVVAGLVLAGCGKNPFGPGATGLSIFAKIGKAIGKPSAVNDEQNSKENAKNTMAAPKTFLNKGLADEKSAAVLVSGIRDTVVNGPAYVYFETMLNKPSEEDVDKKMTGTGEVVFKYNGDPRVQFNPANVTDIISWHFNGLEEKSWVGGSGGQICSLDILINFDISRVDSIVPGTTVAWAKNISPTLDLGRDDTAHFSLTTLIGDKQYGDGGFYDAHTGKENNEPAKSFHFDLEVWHMGTFTDYKDNQGIMTFAYPWGESGDSLYFMIHFYPNYERTGTIRKNSQSGPVLVDFQANDKTGAYKAIIYNEKGEEVETDTN